MIALTASLFFLFYVLVPGGIFRFALSLAVPLKKFQKTKTQEITFAVIASFLPFWFAMALVWSFVTVPFATNETTHQRRQAYRTVFTGLQDDKSLEDAVSKGSFWPAVNSALRRQARFLFWFYILVIIEAILFWWLASRYGRFRGRRFYDFVAEQLLIPSISEWHILLTDFAVRTDGPRAVEVDILTSEAILYQGIVSDYFLNAEGELSGILLSGASRFDSEEYADHRKADIQIKMAPEQFRGLVFTQSKSNYWKKIPGTDLFYIARERISNLNARQAAASRVVTKAAQTRLQERGINFTISEEDDGPPPDEGSPPADVPRAPDKK